MSGIYSPPSTGTASSVFTEPVTFNATNDPATVSPNTLKLYGKSVSGRMLAKIKSSSGLDFPLQPSLFQNQIAIISCSSGTANPTAFGTGISASGTINHTYNESLGYVLNLTTAATANSTAGISNATTMWQRGNVAGSNGFFFSLRIAFPDASYSELRAFAGFYSFTLPTAVNSSDNPVGDLIGFRYSTTAGDINFQITAKDNTTLAAVDTGMPFTPSQVYDLYLFNPPAPNGDTVGWKIDNLSLGTSNSGIISTNLPRYGFGLRSGFQICNIGAVARKVAFQRLYCESDR